VGGIVGKLTFDRDAVLHSTAGAVAVSQAGTIRAVVDGDSVAAVELLRAYEACGDACIERLEGPFACAIWDASRRRLLLARDRAGLRRLCFAVLPGHGIVFGSDAQDLFREPAVGREWNPEAVDAYLALGYVPAPLSMYRRVSKLEAGHTLVVEGLRFSTRRYACQYAAVECSEAEAIDRLEWHLAKALARTDDPLLLSGGLASATLASLASHDRECIVVSGAGDSGAVMRARAIAVHRGQRIAVERPLLGSVETASFLAWHLDEPLGDPAAVDRYSIFAAAALHGAAVTGLGASTAWDHDCGAREAVFADDDRHALYTRTFSGRVRHSDPLGVHDRAPRTDTPAASAQHVASAAGVCARSPYFDREPMQLMITLSHAHRTGPLGALRCLAARRLPASLLPPAAVTRSASPWLPAALKALVPVMLLGERSESRGIFSRAALQSLWSEHCSGRRDHGRRLWSLVMLEFWFRAFIDGDAVAEPEHAAVLVRAA
jgi:asparagine synthetase B (glutamine-hydrolysing)